MAEPCAYLTCSSRVHRVHGCGVPIDGPSDPIVARDNEYPCNDERPPPEPPKYQLRSEPLLYVQHPIRLFERADHALDLYDGCCPVAGMDAEHIDRSAFAEFGEGEFDVRLPAARGKYRDGALDEGGVSLIEQAVRCGAVPPGNESASTASRLKNSPDASEADLVRVPSFDSEHIAARNGGSPRQRRLGMPRSLPDQPQELRQSLVVRVHPGDSFDSATYRPLIPTC